MRQQPFEKTSAVVITCHKCKREFEVYPNSAANVILCPCGEKLALALGREGSVRG